MHSKENGPAPDKVPARIRLDVAYDGTDFSGWAVQPGRRTVAGELTAALERLVRTPTGLTVAGRTDAGVHATGQVCHVDIPAGKWDELGSTLVRRLAGLLPADVRVRAASRVPESFDARFSALWRRYQYRVTDIPSGANPLRRLDTLTWPRQLDLDAMAEAAALLEGEHDFAAFCRRKEHATTIRRITEFSWHRKHEDPWRVRGERGDPVGRSGPDEGWADGDEVSGWDDTVLVATVQADAFCQQMVRSLVGAMLAVGEGRRPPQWPAELLRSTERSSEVLVAPAHGLTLVAVGYPANEDDYAVRAAATRRVRAAG